MSISAHLAFKLSFPMVMWVNVLKHVTNQHEWYNGKCSHGPLEETEKEWIQKDSPPMQALREIVLDKQFLKTFPFYTRFRHTGKLESYHSHRLMYTPKRCSFTFEGTITRSLLAAIDHNHHLCRKQAKNKKGNKVFSRRWSKRAKRWKVVVIKEKKKYSYLPLLCAKALKDLRMGKSQEISYENNPKIIAPTIAPLPAPPTAQLVQKHISRF